MSAFKIVTLTGLILLGIVLDLGGGPSHDRIGEQQTLRQKSPFSELNLVPSGFRYWKEPGPFAHYVVSHFCLVTKFGLSV